MIASSPGDRLIHRRRAVARKRLGHTVPCLDDDVRPAVRFPTIPWVVDAEAIRVPLPTVGRPSRCRPREEIPAGTGSLESVLDGLLQRCIHPAPKSDTAAEALDVKEQLLQGEDGGPAEEARAHEQIRPGERRQEPADRTLGTGLGSGQVRVGAAGRGLRRQAVEAGHLRRGRAKECVLHRAAREATAPGLHDGQAPARR